MGIPPAGDPQIPSTDKGIWSKKSFIGTWDTAVRRAKSPIGMPRKQRTLRTADAHLSITIAPGSMSTYIPKNRPWVPKSAPEPRPRMNNNLRELLATSVILGMCAGRWGRNGSSRRRIRSLSSRSFVLYRDSARGDPPNPLFCIGILFAKIP